jgi:hypothetical protein
MHAPADKTQENKSQSITNRVSQKKINNETTFPFTNNRPEAKKAIQLQKIANNYSSKQQYPIQKKNNTGLPDNLKSGIENLSGHSMNDVKVHYNSPKPAQLQAHAYAQGTDIHLGSGQEKHLPHEAWHVVQQKQGRVKPTKQLKSKVNINDDAELEKEADVMGVKALQKKSTVNISKTSVQKKSNAKQDSRSTHHLPLQLMKYQYVKSELKISKGVTDKLVQVNTILSKIAAKFGDDKSTVKLKLINEGGMSPAFSSHEQDSKKDYTGDVVITLNRWYAEKASVGDIVGMLTHELGVHGMTDRHMGFKPDGKGGLTADKHSEIITERKEENKPHTTKGGLTHGPHTLAAINRKKPDRRQEDHVNIGKGMITGKAHSRAQVYIQSFLAAGDAIFNNKEVSNDKRKQQLRDLIQSFFFDVARIVATDDGKPLAMFSKTKAIAELMIFYHTDVIKSHSIHHSWLLDKSLQPEASGWGLRGHLLGLIGQLLISSNPSIKHKRNGLIGSGLVTAGASLLGGLTLGPALAAGAAAGLGIWGISKLLG